MEENDVIKYNDKEYSLSELIKNLNPLSYLSTKKWSEKKKREFFAAYEDIVNTGITGGNENTLTTKQTPSKYDEDNPMYGYAANYILKIFDKINPIKSGEVVATSEEDLPEIKNTKYSNNMFYSYLNNLLFGGLYANDVKGFSTAWNRYADLDRDETGSRGTSQRIEVLKTQLLNYKNSIAANNYDFEGSAYSNKEDLLARIDNAINALNRGDERTIYTSLSSIGIVPEMVLDKGLDDVYQTALVNGQPLNITYRLYYAAQQEANKLNNQQEEEKLNTEEQNKQNNSAPDYILNPNSVLNKSWDDKMLYKYTGPNINRSSKIKLGKVSSTGFNHITIKESVKDPYSYTILASDTRPVDVVKTDITKLKSIVRKISQNYPERDKNKLKEMGWLKQGGTINSNINLIISNFINKLKYGNI